MSATTDLIHQLAARGLTQTDIAKRTGIPQPRLSRWANGNTPAGADDALKLQALLVDMSAQLEATPASVAAQPVEASHAQ